ncbi:MAG: 16S rRNA (cytidine(1402)-2'-O)-methyltransferase [Chloroflexi bacterium]|nr:16S rRNA (cytidine(1402)-2'-O)-methyltransferase [Chloroflexota bacterium]MCI0580660.1 16S rRNA (cytidine(1402)-2'-O)-methyltransferase [Chloroflexota bacterium]MCI0648676.1 16S rRNA (cytidine(1402)-2'-O)-methyltransferase [Chloroflexota bacterium]MCI0728084.1 16S rRNA (cytidine(1402)-2'-O)-methyltransferase [Chloroflexota bacterium]
MPVLYLVGTPIGNLEDITLRALRVLREVSLVAAEDTRTTGRLLSHYHIETPLISYHEYSGPGRVAELVERLATADVALVSDAGMPGLSDPGYRLIQAALEAGLTVVPIPGPSAAIAALVSSGLPTDSFLFLGFLPRQQKARRAVLAQVAALPHTLILYEAPHRLLALLADVIRTLGDRAVSVGRELTKLYEETWRGPASQAIAYFGQGPIRGELTVVIAGASGEAIRWDEAAVRAALAAHLAQGLSRKEAAAVVAAQSGWRRREVYNLE